MTAEIGTEVEPDVRADTTSSSQSTSCRRYCCTKCRGDGSEDDAEDEDDTHRWDTTGSKLIDIDRTEESERGHPIDISTHCANCGAETWHVPVGDPGLGYYNWQNAQLRQQEGNR